MYDVVSMHDMDFDSETPRVFEGFFSVPSTYMYYYYLTAVYSYFCIFFFLCIVIVYEKQKKYRELGYVWRCEHRRMNKKKEKKKGKKGG